MTKEKEKKVGKDQLLLEASRLGHLHQLESILGQLRQLRSKKKSNPLASLRKTFGPNNIRDPVTGFTCLHHASLNGHSQCVKLILDYGAKLNAVDYKGSSALHLASWAGNLEIVRILLEHQVSLSPKDSTTDSDQQSPTTGFYNTNKQRYQTIEVNLCNNDNQTPLSLAAQFGHHAVVGELLAHGADVHIRNSQLESPLDLACLNGRLETVDLLLKCCPDLLGQLRAARSLLISTSGTIGQRPASVANSELAGQRPSGGWSSLLRGRRDSAQTNSPLHRFTAGTLSMRQKSFAGPQEPLSPRMAGLDSRPRRATLTVGAPPATEAVRSKERSIEWPQSSNETTSNALDEQEERLLDHSPLHYATRKGQLSVVNLLLYTYGANLLQISSLGSVLHEIALNNGKHSDMIGLFFAFIGSKQKHEVRLELLNTFLNLKNAQQKSVFEVLNEINNRSAQEIKRLIYEFSEQIQKQLVCSRPIEQTVQFNNQKLANLNTQSSSNETSSQQQFSDIQQFNSFVTMKRVPKNQQRQQLTDVTSNYFSNNNNNNELSANNGTQTIDRRFRRQNEQMTQQVSIDPPKAYIGQQTMTRSVSNLNRAPIQQYSRQLQDETSLMWREWLMRGKQCDQDLAKDGCRAKRRSKSRDYVSNLNEANQVVKNEHLYDNSSGESHHLVRSQTDCSHLMGRFFGNQDQVLATNAPISGPAKQHQQCTLDRKTINRHYHVYDHEFYPPRLLSQITPESGKTPQQTGAISQMLARTNDSAGPQLRASVRSTKSSQSSSKAQQPRPPHQDQDYIQNSILRNNSRLSLNIEPPESICREQWLQMQCLKQQKQAHLDRFLGRHARKSVAAPASDLGLGGEGRVASADQKRRDLIELQRRLLVESSQKQQIQSSYSLESHLSEPHLFETTRQALMNDFDQMIGQELLNRNHRQIIDGALQHRSILTGVSLDMDRYGDRLTVSGTQVTLPNETKLLTSKSCETKRRSNSTLDSDDQLSGANSVISCNSVSTQTKSEVATLEEEYPLEPPPKPPRLSLINKQPARRKVTTSQRMSAHLQRAVIYDLPAASDAASCPKRPPNAVRSQSSFSGSKLVRTGAHTEAPKVRPPPPPMSAQQAITTPLHVLPPNSADHPLACSSSSSTGSTTANDIGLLKMASMRSESSSCSSSALRAKNTHTLSDQDSGVCTSNSPASLSHEPESPPVEQSSKLVMRSNADCPAVIKHLARTANRVTPTPADSPKNEAPPSPKTAQLCIEEALLPLAKTADSVNQTTSPLMSCNSFACSRSVEVVGRWLTNKGNSDYENCQALQMQLQQAQSDFEHQSIIKSSELKVCSFNKQDDDDCDYAETGSEQNSATSSGSMRGSDGELPQSNVIRGKELTLKVMIDENERGSSNENQEVFYIDPLELKKIAAQRGNQMDAETLTDEELFAAIDKNSGYIRFTLRKRRNTNDEEDQNATTQQNQVLHSNQDKITHSNIKKTKLHSKDALNGKVDQILKADDLPAIASNEFKSSCQQLIHKASALKLKQWFTTNLVGLVEYSDKFLQNGFDNLQFLNHPFLINNDLLESIGIADESHRLLIGDRITKELTKVEFETLIAKQDLSTRELLEVLQMDHILEEKSFRDANTIESLRMKQAELPIGYRIRLSLAIDSLIKANCPTQSLQKQVSSESSEVEMDTSHVSATSSSSSKESIKSIVLVKSSAEVGVETEFSKSEEIEGESCAVEEQNKVAPELRQLINAVKSSRSNSLVSEAARKLEAVAEQKSGVIYQKPVAAIRRINTTKPIIEQNQNDQENAVERDPVLVRSPTITSPPFVPVKSVCWPPPKTSQQNKQQVTDAPIIPKLNPNRFSYQKHLESKLKKEQNKPDESGGPIATKLRPKPAPPAKPAKLAVVNKFIAETSHKL